MCAAANRAPAQTLQWQQEAERGTQRCEGRQHADHPWESPARLDRWRKGSDGARGQDLQANRQSEASGWRFCVG